MRALLVVMFVAGCTKPAPLAPTQPAPEAAQKTQKAEEAVQPAATRVFPADWVGRWHGNVLARSGKKSREFGMILDIVARPEGRYQWKITYALDDGNNIRDYELVAVDAESGAYQIDEKNGIVINATLAGQTLYTLFDVGGPVLDFRYTMTSAGIQVDVVSALPKKATMTGGGEVPEIKNLPINGIQQALLVKMPTPAGATVRSP